MIVILPEELTKKNEDARKYILPNGEWKPDTPNRIKEDYAEVIKFYQENVEDSL